MLPSDSYSTVYVGIDKLKNSGFLENTDINDPKTAEKINGCIIIRLEATYNQYSYEFINLATETDNNCKIDIYLYQPL